MYCTVNLRAIASLVEAVRRLKDAGHPVIVISSGAVGAGCQKLGLKSRPDDVAQRQALAAVGQVHLMRFYEDLFTAVGLTCSQVLLTLDNLADHDQYQNAAATFSHLLNYGVVPIVNENDTVAVESLKIGDNDTLAAQVATLVEAEWLFLLTDVDALYTANPAVDPTATPIREVSDMTQLINVSTAGASGGAAEGGSQWGTGGMATKLTAANLATAAGTRMVICNGDPELVPRMVLDGEQIGTVFLPAPAPVQGHKRWILSTPARGQICLRADAAEALRNGTTAVFVEGVTDILGDFESGDAVVLRDESGTEVGRGLVELSSDGMCSTLTHLLEDNSRFSEVGLDHAWDGTGSVVVAPTNVCLLPAGAASTTEDGCSIGTVTGSESASMVSSPRVGSKWASSGDLIISSPEPCRTGEVLKLAARKVSLSLLG